MPVHVQSDAETPLFLYRHEETGRYYFFHSFVDAAGAKQKMAVMLARDPVNLVAPKKTDSKFEAAAVPLEACELWLRAISVGHLRGIKKNAERVAKVLCPDPATESFDGWKGSSASKVPPSQYPITLSRALAAFPQLKSTLSRVALLKNVLAKASETTAAPVVVPPSSPPLKRKAAVPASPSSALARPAKRPRKQTASDTKKPSEETALEAELRQENAALRQTNSALLSAFASAMASSLSSPKLLVVPASLHASSNSIS